MLVTLDALLHEGSVSGAARRLGLSTPAVSHALARLRERMGDPLLVRAGRHMVLTPRAETLRPQVRDAVALGTRVFDAPAAFDPSRLDRTFVMSMTDYVLMVIGGDLEERLSRDAPRVALRVLPSAVDDAERLRRGDADLALGIYGPLPPELRTRVVITDRFVCVVREGHPRVKQRISLEQFLELEHVQVAPRGQPGGYLDELLAGRGLTRRVARAVPFFQLALELTARSDYVLTVSERLAKLLGPRLGLRLLDPPIPLEPYALSMVWHPRFDGDPAHGWLREQLVSVSEGLRGPPLDRARKRLSPTDPTTGHGRRPRRKRA